MIVENYLLTNKNIDCRIKLFNDQLILSSNILKIISNNLKLISVTKLITLNFLILKLNTSFLMLKSYYYIDVLKNYQGLITLLVL